jgi:hypothetical protein
VRQLAHWTARVQSDLCLIVLGVVGKAVSGLRAWRVLYGALRARDITSLPVNFRASRENVMGRGAFELFAPCERGVDCLACVA